MKLYWLLFDYTIKPLSLGLHLNSDALVLFFSSIEIPLESNELLAFQLNFYIAPLCTFSSNIYIALTFPTGTVQFLLFSSQFLFFSAWYGIDCIFGSMKMVTFKLIDSLSPELIIFCWLALLTRTTLWLCECRLILLNVHRIGTNLLASFLILSTRDRKRERVKVILLKLWLMRELFVCIAYYALLAHKHSSNLINPPTV